MAEDVVAPVAAAPFRRPTVPILNFGKHYHLCGCRRLGLEGEERTVKARIIPFRFGTAYNITIRADGEDDTDGAYLWANGARVKSFLKFFSGRVDGAGRRRGVWVAPVFLELREEKSRLRYLKLKRGYPGVSESWKIITNSDIATGSNINTAKNAKGELNIDLV